jgi:hypothetical protein
MALLYPAAHRLEANQIHWRGSGPDEAHVGVYADRLSQCLERYSKASGLRS